MPLPRATSDRPRMAMLVGNHVSGDSRVEKSAASAVRAGYEVVVIGVRHRTRHALDRYGSVPILRVPVPFCRHAAWVTLHAGPHDATDWSAVLAPDEATAMVRADARRDPGLAQAAARGLAPHALPGGVRGRVRALGGAGTPRGDHGSCRAGRRLAPRLAPDVRLRGGLPPGPDRPRAGHHSCARPPSPPGGGGLLPPSGGPRPAPRPLGVRRP